MVDLNTRQVTVLPGSKGLFSPAWSPDGRHIAAVTIEGSKKLWMYDVRAKKWSEWFTDSDGVADKQWSADSRYIYYDTLSYNDTSAANLVCRRSIGGPILVSFSNTSARNLFPGLHFCSGALELNPGTKSFGIPRMTHLEPHRDAFENVREEMLTNTDPLAM